MIARLRAWSGGLLRLNGTPRGIAGGFAVGVGLSLIPVPFLGMVLALAVAPLLRLSVAGTYLGTAVINPFTGAAFYFGELWLGLWLGGRPLPAWAALAALDGAGWWQLFKEMLGPFALGAAVAIPTLSALSYALVYWLVAAYQRRHPPAQAESRSAAAAGAVGVAREAVAAGVLAGGGAPAAPSAGAGGVAVSRRSRRRRRSA